MLPEYEELRKKLEQQREELLHDLKQEGSAILGLAETAEGEAGGYSSHLGDDSANVFEREKDITLERTLSGLLAEVEYALVRFREGTYGKCEECGQPISLARLQALPYARLCISCKSLQEKRMRELAR